MTASNTVKNILILHTTSSFNTLSGKEALDLSLIFGAYEQHVSVVFIDQGVFQTIAHQDPESIEQKDYLSTIKALDIYDIEQVFVSQHSLQKYGFQHSELLPDIEPINAESLHTLKQQADHVYVI